jgi:peptidoglycan/LPS O-acetylase OafA/YrhL
VAEPRNNFDLLRLLFAGTVCLVHAYELSGQAALAWIGAVLSTDVAVKAFFVVSGYLIFMSYERSASLASYAAKRVRRIYPAYCVVIVACALGLVAASTLAPSGYFSAAWARYLGANLAFLNFLAPTLPGVFESNRLAAVNGALWTLKIEVMFYLAVPLLAWSFGRFGRLPMLAGLYVASILYSVGMGSAAARTGVSLYAELGRQLPGQLAYFLGGAFFYYYRPLFERHVVAFVAAALVVTVAHRSIALPLFEPLALATLVAFAALFAYVGNFGKYGDFSYGVYIVHFPIVQLVVQAGWLADRPYAYLATVLALTGIAAFALWHLVEKRFLARDNHYVSATRAGSVDSQPIEPPRERPA